MLLFRLTKAASRQPYRRYFSKYTLFNETSLGLSPSLVDPHLDNLKFLPEIASALDPTTSNTQVLANLQRAREIFAPLASNEYTAVLALIAEYQQSQADYASAIETLQQLQQTIKNKNARTDIDLDLAIAKAHWCNGDFDEGHRLCMTILERPEIDSLPMHAASARTGQAVCQICACNTLDHAFIVRDPPRMALKYLERFGNKTQLARAAASLNMGISEVVYVDTVRQHYKDEENDHVPFDGALRYWRQGVTLIQQYERNTEQAKRKDKQQKQNETDVSKSLLMAQLQVRMYANMAWGLLQMKQIDDSVQRASDMTRKALQVYDDNPQLWSTPGVQKDKLCRVLTLIATCYHKTDAAVTAQGLFQSAIDSGHALSPASSSSSGSNNPPSIAHMSPMALLDLREAYRRYAILCRDWEKREGEAERYEKQADAITAQLPPGWQDKSSIYSSLWFWTPYMFLK
jgi:tetratricopeptide (TPR) repeat protein